MDRRHFLRFSGAACAATAATAVLPHAARAQQAPVATAWRTYELTTAVSITDPAAHTRIWLPVPYATDTSYQRGVQNTWQTSGGGVATLTRAPG